jgi:hypothetical protein
MYNSLFCTTYTKPDEYQFYLALRERRDNVFVPSVRNNPRVRPYFNQPGVEQILVEVAEGNRDYSRLIIDSSTSRGQVEVRPLLTELALLQTHLWDIQRRLTVGFLDGDTAVHQRFQSVVGQWLQHIGLCVAFVPANDATVRVSFSQLGSWSRIGTSALAVKNPQLPTMNIDLRDAPLGSTRFDATVLHEFGHCLGCVHEHQSPAAGIVWNRQNVYRICFQQYGWEPAMVDQNFFSQADAQEITNSTYDPDSIMHYPYPAEFTLDGRGIDYNITLSAQDISFIQQCYPQSSSTSAQLLKS